MDSVDRHLVHRDTRLIQLLDPPFDRSKPTPGYIQGYVPGVRENGGQYTHAAVWAALAFAAQGDSERAWELLALLDPGRHGGSAEAIATYRVEPYVVAGDVYAFAPHAGRGGWTWYTGSAGWMYRLIVESLLGLTRRGTRLSLHPLWPKDWQSFQLDYRFGASTYLIECRAVAIGQAAGRAAEPTAQILLDGLAVAGDGFDLTDDGRTHRIVVSVSRARIA
jgi:cellobiose phosphorylase